MQYFIQWQRYRKYWWSSITTTPSLFSINMMQGVESADVNIIANFSCGAQIVETIGINSNDSENNNNNATHSSSLTCAMGLETALLTLLLDGITNATKEEYLKLHNKMAPYKISFALDSIGVHEDEKILSILKELAQLIFHKLSKNEISSWLPNFTLPLQLQIKENLQMGVTYTAILNENTLSNGIFHLLNSNTMLKEQVHVADFDTYAALLCGKD
uniref:DNA polymerase accessory subunit n=1 Tax=Pararge aegeria TaxID=116150 RepID=S4PTF4_9NEOP